MSSSRPWGAKAPLSFFRNLHKGEKCLILGNGPSVSEIDIEGLNLITIGANTIYKRYMPDYYVSVDNHDFKDEITTLKILATPDLDDWKGNDIVRWWHRPVPLWPSDFEEGIDYLCVMHVMMQLAYFMGFTTMYVVIDHNQDNRQKFWGMDKHLVNKNLDEWADGYKELREGFGVEMLNIAPLTELPESIIPRYDWKKLLHTQSPEQSEDVR